MPPAPRKIWFPAKTYGYGWGPPRCWQGWMVTVLYVVLLCGGSVVILRDKSNMPWFLLYVLGLSLALIFVCWLKGEKPEWRWGDKDK